jgi:hypothetical protein
VRKIGELIHSRRNAIYLTVRRGNLSPYEQLFEFSPATLRCNAQIPQRNNRQWRKEQRKHREDIQQWEHDRNFAWKYYKDTLGKPGADNSAQFSKANIT